MESVYGIIGISFESVLEIIRISFLKSFFESVCASSFLECKQCLQAHLAIEELHTIVKCHFKKSVSSFKISSDYTIVIVHTKRVLNASRITIAWILKDAPNSIAK